MKRKQEPPSVVGLLLIVAGMLLLSMVLFNLTSTGTLAPGSGKITLALSGAALGCLATGAGLSARKRKS